ncbi:hypothetical protein ABZW38_02895 [Streptomyces bacillaris]|uniref:hypothetical protein n=1 Tax=Streptomyces bacillaris TaxID=68179 RepID=UPI003460387D
MDRWDVLVLVGVIFVGLGLFLLAPWLGITVTGLVLLAVGVTGAHSANRTTGDQLQKGA